jgi:2-polyprenyl-3-methyl-5-hydroxy-6-metoxy-1,4-benzoquinol methylase
MAAGRSGWNHNIHYHPVVLAAVPAGAERALDVGCGTGLLARELREQVPYVMGVDADEPALTAARAADPDGSVDYVLGDFRETDLRPESFDFISCVAALHHMDAAAALGRMAGLLRRGGRLAVVGLARIGSAADLPAEVAGSVVRRFELLRREYTEVTAPVLWPPPVTYGAMRRIAREVLPGARFRRRALWRYTLTWRKPGA